MLAIGIPSYNESGNIASLITRIDNIAQNHDLPIMFINSDNNSPDGTSKVFTSTPTAYEKVALTSKEIGKGRNIRNILEYVVANNIEYVELVDADVTTFEESWLLKHQTAAYDGYDLVCPSYARYYIEGNTTNHFSFPVLNYWTKGNCTRQPIAGDIGISLKLAKSMCQKEWPQSAMRYGIDMFIVMHAYAGGFKCKEIQLHKKIHNPSYDKIVSIFTDEAESYYDFRKYAARFEEFINHSSEAQYTSMLDTYAIEGKKIKTSRRHAQELFASNNRLVDFNNLPKNISPELWANILVSHEKLVGTATPREVAESLCPYFLIRTATYLETVNSSTEAERHLAKQKDIIYQAYSQALL